MAKTSSMSSLLFLMRHHLFFRLYLKIRPRYPNFFQQTYSSAFCSHFYFDVPDIWDNYLVSKQKFQVIKLIPGSLPRTPGPEAMSKRSFFINWSYFEPSSSVRSSNRRYRYTRKCSIYRAVLSLRYYQCVPIRDQEWRRKSFLLFRSFFLVITCITRFLNCQ